MRDHRRRFRFLRKKHSILGLILENSQSWILISLIGISIGFIAGWIDVSAAFLTDLKSGFCTKGWYATRKSCCKYMMDANEECSEWKDWSAAILWFSNLFLVNWFFYIFFSTLYATLCAFLVIHLSLYAAGSGTAEIKTILGGFMIKGFLGIRTLAIKVIGLPLSVASGLAVGKEGPMIHVASCVGNIFPRLFPKYKGNEAKKREILSASCAAGVAVAFGAPIGGVLFSLEELSSFFPSKTMVFYDEKCFFFNL